MEGRLSLGHPVDIDVFTRSASHLRRILETLGIKRVPHEVNPHLDTYLATPKNPDVVNGDATSKQPHAGREVVTQPETAPAEAEPEGTS